MTHKAFFLRGNTYEQLPDWLYGNRDAKDLFININCLGRDVLCAIEAVNLMGTLSANITTTIIGAAESSALLIAMSGNVRKAYYNSWGMAHPFSTTIEGDYFDHVDAQKHNEILHEMLFRIVQEKTKLTKRVIYNRLLGRKTAWLTVDDLLELNIIDSVIYP